MVKRRHTRSKGFTLIELAIVVGLIAILVAGIVIGTGTLGKDAKASKIAEFVKNVQTAAGICKTKNLQAFLNPTNFHNNFNIMVQDSQCRTSNPDKQGIFPQGLIAPSGVGNFTISYTSASGVLSIDFILEDNALAKALYNVLKSQYDVGNSEPTGNTLRVNMLI